MTAPGLVIFVLTYALNFVLNRWFAFDAAHGHAGGDSQRADDLRCPGLGLESELRTGGVEGGLDEEQVGERCEDLAARIARHGDDAVVLAMTRWRLSCSIVVAPCTGLGTATSWNASGSCITMLRKPYFSG